MTAIRPMADAELVALADRLQAADANELALELLGALHPGHTRAQLAAVPVDRRDAQLLRWRRANFGDGMEATSCCPACAERIEYTLSVQALLAGAQEKGAEGDALAGTGSTLALPPGETPGPPMQLRHPNSQDVGEALGVASASPAASADEAIDAGVQALLLRCLAGSLQPGQDLPALADAFGQGLADVAPLADPQVALQCLACGTQWDEALDIARFLRADIDAAAARLLHEVHALALAYHWSERDILALPAARRRFYLGCL